MESSTPTPQARPVFLQLLKLLHGYSKHPVADLQD